MAYLTEQKSGSKVYYYLVENIKIGKSKRKQLRKYIGDKKPSEQKLQILMSEFAKEVEKKKVEINKYYYLTPDEIKKVDSVNKAFQDRFKKLNKEAQEQFIQNFVMVFVYNTNSIEGSTLTEKEVELLLAENISPHKPLDDVLEAKSCAKVLEYVRNNKKELNESLILELHKMYFNDTKPHIAGKYKKKDNKVYGSKFKTTPHNLVPTDMKLLFKELKENKDKLHPLELAAWVHWKFVKIHPFQDGNGRIARIIMNLVLTNNDYAMIDIKTKYKQQYFKALEKCNYNENGEALATLLVKRFVKQYENALK